MFYLFICFGFWATFFVVWQKKKSGCRRNNLLIQKKLQERNCRKFVFFIFFGLRAQKFEQLDKNTRRIVKTTFKLVRGAILGRSFQMKKLCSSFLVVERNYWTFGWNFLSNFSKLQPTGAAERFDVFLERRVTVWSFLVSEWKKPSFGKKFMAFGRVAKSAFHVSSAKLWEKMTKLIYTIIISVGTLSEIFYDFEKK